jgi:hypothetical protein
MSKEQRHHAEVVKALIGHLSYSEEFKEVLVVQKKARRIWIG